MRLQNKVAIIAGAGQTPGDTIGNGRATAILFAREGASVVLVDRDPESARETQAMIQADGGACFVCEADITRAEDCSAFTQAALDAYGRIDILHNNVGVGAGDTELVRLVEEAWDRILEVNLKGLFLSCRQVLPVMRQQQQGCIINISSIAAVCSATSLTAYKISKAGVNAMTQTLAIGNAKYGVRVNAIMPGLINTPMAIESHMKARNIAKADLIRERDSQVPLRGKMGTAWDVAHAALFLASDEAQFITGVALPVDGGQSARIG
ncbi:MAG: SDR family oxidoreductase [Acidobacteria bacterium]|nr:SDR family oxidoreductase [Acidobacteriota bacterium]